MPQEISDFNGANDPEYIKMLAEKRKKDLEQVTEEASQKAANADEKMRNIIKGLAGESESEEETSETETVI